MRLSCVVCGGVVQTVQQQVLKCTMHNGAHVRSHSLAGACEGAAGAPLAQQSPAPSFFSVLRSSEHMRTGVPLQGVACVCERAADMRTAHKAVRVLDGLSGVDKQWIVSSPSSRGTIVFTNPIVDAT